MERIDSFSFAGFIVVLNIKMADPSSSQESYTTESSYSYSYSYSDESTSGSYNGSIEMWNQIERMPLSHLEKTENFTYIAKVMNLVNHYEFSLDDHHLKQPKYTFLVGQMLKLICSKCSTTLKKKDDAYSALESTKRKAEEGFRIQLEAQHQEVLRLRGIEEKVLIANTPRSEDLSLLSEVRRLKEENDSLSNEVRTLSRANNDLIQSTEIRKDDRDEVNEYNSKILLEFKHLATKHNKLLEKAKQMEETVQELRSREEIRSATEGNELAVLKEKLESLQIENANLVHSRDRAEELCEHREAQALRDMAELRQVTKRITQAEVEKFEMLKVDFANFKSESEVRLEEIINQHEIEISEKEEEIRALQIQVGKTQRLFDGDSDETSVSTVETQKVVTVSSAQYRLQRENNDLSAEIEQLEIRLDSAHEENSRLSRIVKDYENGNDGLRNLRHSLADSNRTNELLQNQITQLRERLHAMEDCLAFSAALQELCRRIGVTDDEINSLKSTSTQTYSEMDTLKDELNILKEEVEWLEKDRRHWMNKVRLQPLMDTKLRFELGLTADQLKQLDSLVEQMKSGSLVLEDDDANYREKYLKELQIRKNESAKFNEFVKGRIDSALKHALEGVERSGFSHDALTALQQHIDVIAPLQPVDSTEHELANKQLRDQLESFSRRVDQLELSRKTDAEHIVSLNEQLGALKAEKETILKECEQYKTLVFAHITGNSAEQKSGVHEKWAGVAASLRDQVAAKDDLIKNLNAKVNLMSQKVDADKESRSDLTREITVLQRTIANLNDQLSAIHESNEDLMDLNSQLSKANKDLTSGMEELNNVTHKELLQKIILLRKRESALIQRLRRVTTEKENASATEGALKTSMKGTLASLKAILDGSSNGFVLPPSTTTQNAEQGLLTVMHEAVSFLTKGKLYREDSAYLAKLFNVYCSVDDCQMLTELREKVKLQQSEIDRLSEELEHGTKECPLATTICEKLDSEDSNSENYYRLAANKWESEASLWKQKHALCSKRLEVKENEVSLIESDLLTTKEEVIKVKGYIQQIFSKPDVQSDRLNLPIQNVEPESEEAPKVAALSIHKLEVDVARLKSINFSLLQHCLDIQAANASLKAEVEGKKQEISLLRSSSNGDVVSEFISASINEHSSLRRESEMAQIRLKKMQIKLVATEANLQIVSNEATAYKLGAYRLYRKYVDEVVKVVDYLRSIQRASAGALSPHRAEILDRRYTRILNELETEQSKNANLAVENESLATVVSTLEHQIEFLKEGVTDESLLKVERRLREAHAKARENTRLLSEAREDEAHLSSKVTRMSEYINDLNDDLTRLEFGCIGVSPLDETMLRNLLTLKDTVFSATQAPPLALTIVPAANGNDSDGAQPIDAHVLKQYKESISREVELAKVNSALRLEVEKQKTEQKQLAADAAELQRTIKRLEGQVQYSEKMLEDAKKAAENKEIRLSRAHDTQSSVATRAAEHTIRCLQELVQKKDHSLQQLQLQLQAERQKSIDCQTSEFARIEKLHEDMFKSNGAMAARFHSLINTDTTDVSEVPTGSTQILADQVRAQTSQIIALKKELMVAHEANINLESQLSILVKQGQPLHTAPDVPCSEGGVTPADAGTAARPNDAATAMSMASTDSLSGLVRSQQAIIDSVRQREMGVSQELTKEREARISSEREVEQLRLRLLGQCAPAPAVVLTHHTTDSMVPPAPGGVPVRSTAEEELRLLLSQMEQNLSYAREELLEERRTSELLRQDAESWRAHLEMADAVAVKQSAEVEKAKGAAVINAELQSDLQNIKSQNEKLILAASLLKQRLMEEAQRGGDAGRKLQQEVALTQRLGVIQEESSKHVKDMDTKLRSLQSELDERVAKEKGSLQQFEENQRLVLQLRLQVKEKERTIADLKKEKTGVQSTNLPSQPAAQPTANRLSTKLTDTDAMMRPQLASVMSAELHKLQRDNLQEISNLRASQRRLESDLSESRLQLRSERDAAVSLRVQLSALKKEKEGLEESHAKEILRIHQSHNQQHPSPTTTTAVPVPSTLPTTDTSILEKRIAELEQLLQKAQSNTTPAQPPSVPSATPLTVPPTSGSLNGGECMTSIRSLEAVIDQLQKKVSVDAVSQVNALEQKINSLRRVLQQVCAEMASLKNVPLSTVLDAYQISSETEVTSNSLEATLLAKTNALTAAQFECDNMKTRLERSERQLQELLAKSKARTPPANTGTADVTVLQTLVANLQVMVERLTSENEAMKSKASSKRSASADLKAARSREDSLKEQLDQAREYLISSRASSGANAAYPSGPSTLLDARDIPPLPQNPYARRAAATSRSDRPSTGGPRRDSGLPQLRRNSTK